MTCAGEKACSGEDVTRDPVLPPSLAAFTPSVSPSPFRETPAQRHFSQIETGRNCPGRLGGAGLK